MNSQVSINSRGNGERTNNPIESNQIKLAYRYRRNLENSKKNFKEQIRNALITYMTLSL